MDMICNKANCKYDLGTVGVLRTRLRGCAVSHTSCAQHFAHVAIPKYG